MSNGEHIESGLLGESDGHHEQSEDLINSDNVMNPYPAEDLVIVKR